MVNNWSAVIQLDLTDQLLCNFREKLRPRVRGSWQSVQTAAAKLSQASTGRPVNDFSAGELRNQEKTMKATELYDEPNSYELLYLTQLCLANLLSV